MKKLLILLLVLSGCDSPSLAFRDVAARQVVVDGSRFSVRVKGEHAEIIRLSPERWPRFDEVRTKAERAVYMATGCSVVAIDGDVALMKARVRCPP